MKTQRQNKKTYLIIGLGRFGSALCDRLLANGANVIAVDRDMEKVEAFSDRVQYIACLDAASESALEKVGAKDADIAIVCLGRDKQATVMVSAILLDLELPRVIACASDALHARILSKIGVHHVISPQEAMGRRTADLLINPWLHFFSESTDDIHMAGRFPAPEAVLGKPLRELDLQRRYGMTVVSVIRGGKCLLPSADLVMEEGDNMLVFGDRQRMAPLMRQIPSEDMGLFL